LNVRSLSQSILLHEKDQHATECQLRSS
jgi:hypothetical protein